MTSVLRKKISILGAGKIGLALATLWSRAGHFVCIGSRDPGKLQEVIHNFGLNVSIKNIKEAAAESEIILLAVPYSAVQDLVSDLKVELTNKIIIDATNPFGLSPEGHVFSTLGPKITAGSYMASLLPESTVVRAFTHIMEELLVSRGTQQPGLFAVAIAGDDPVSKLLVEKLVRDTGFVPVDIGMLSESGPLDPGGRLFPNVFTPADMRLALKNMKQGSYS